MKQHLIYLLPLLFAIADGFGFRAKTKPVKIWVFNLWLELSKLFYIATFAGCIWLGTVWEPRFIIPLLLIHFVAKSIPFNIAAGLKWNYVGVGIYDTILKFVLQGSVWMWLLLQGICIAFARAIIKKKL